MAKEISDRDLIIATIKAQEARALGKISEMQHRLYNEINSMRLEVAEWGEIMLDEFKLLRKEHKNALNCHKRAARIYEKLHKELMPEKGIIIQELLKAVKDGMEASKRAREGKGVMKEVKEKII